MDRRTALKITGASATALLLAGCPDGTEDPDDEPDADDLGPDPRPDPTDTRESVVDEVDASADDVKVVRIDYDEHEQPTDVYRVWSGDPSAFSFVEADPFDGEVALQCAVPENESNGSNAAYWFPANGYGQPLEVRQHAAVSLEGWTMDEGDVCRIWCAGLNTEAGVQGSGGRGRPSGDDGWSSMLAVTDRERDNEDEYTLAVYTYHMDQDGVSGEFELTNASVPVDEWFELETQVVMNTVDDGDAEPDGEVRCWIDGERVYERTDFRWTTVESQAIEYTGPLVRYGGRETAPTDLAVNYDVHDLAAVGVPDIPEYDEHPFFEDPANMDAYEGRVTYVNGDDSATYRLYVDGFVVHTEWSNVDGQQARYNETMEITPSTESESGYAVAEATIEPNAVDGYLFNGEVVAVDSDPDPIELWIDGDRVDPDDYPSDPDDA